MTDFFAKFNLADILKATMVLFAVIDIIGSIPVILRLKEDVGELNSVRASLVSLGIMIGFLLLGESILSLFGVDVKSFAVAGAFIIFFISLEMILGIKLFRDTIDGKTASIVPLAFPLIAGAGTMTSIISLRAEFAEINIIIAIVLNVAIVYAVLRLSKHIEQILGETGIVIVKKVFGIILLAIAIKLFTSNVSEMF